MTRHPSFSEDVQHAIEAARKAGEHIKDGFGHAAHVRDNGGAFICASNGIIHEAIIDRISKQQPQ